MSVQIVQALTIAFQFVNQTMPDAAIEEMAADLSGYPVDNVLAALKRCRNELKAIRYSDIIDRIPGGHPGPEEAWSVIGPSLANESLTVVWTDQMREAFGVALGLADDPTAARMAFKETYVKLVNEARSRNQGPKWSVSAGTDKQHRALVVQEAVKAGKLLPEYARQFLPLPEPTGNSLARLGGF